MSERLSINHYKLGLDALSFTGELIYGKSI